MEAVNDEGFIGLFKGGLKAAAAGTSAALIFSYIASLIFRNATGAEIRDAARRNGMRTLRDDAMRKAEAGISTVEEVIRVTMMDQE